MVLDGTLGAVISLLGRAALLKLCCQKRRTRKSSRNISISTSQPLVEGALVALEVRGGNLIGGRFSAIPRSQLVGSANGDGSASTKEGEMKKSLAIMAAVCGLAAFSSSAEASKPTLAEGLSWVQNYEYSCNINSDYVGNLIINKKTKSFRWTFYFPGRAAERGSYTVSLSGKKGKNSPYTINLGGFPAQLWGDQIVIEDDFICYGSSGD
jgi:hypothetical protein